MGIELVLDMALGEHPGRRALGWGDGGYTFATLADYATAGAELVRERGAKHLAFLGVNSPAFPIALFSGAYAAVPVVPLNYRLSAEQLAEQLAELEDVLVITDPGFSPVVDRADVPAITTEEFLAAVSAAGAGTGGFTDDDDIAVILFTSGTTSKPKQVLLRHQHLLSYLMQTVEFAGADEADATLVSTPPYHIAGVGAVLSNLYAGRRLAYLPDFSPERWLELVRAEQVSSVMLVPTMLARIVSYLDGAPANTPSLRQIAYGGARMPEPVLLRALECFPQVGFVNAYGLTETSSTIAVLGPDEHRAALTDPALRATLGSVGRAVPGIEMQIRDEDNVVLPDGETGLLWVRGAQVSGEYRGLGSVLDADGWFPTRDRATVTDGFLYIGGRADDTIIRGGENIAPAEIEDVLVHHPGVDEVTVVGMPDDEWGERIVAVVVVRDEHHLEQEEVRSWCRARMRGSRTPDDVVVVDELPRTDTGKVVRARVIELISAA